MEMMLKETKTQGTKKLEVYEAGRYELRVMQNEYYTRYSVSAINFEDRFLPEIYISSEFGSEKQYLKIQTASYGSLYEDEFEEFLKGLEEAKEFAKILRNTFEDII